MSNHVLPQMGSQPFLTDGGIETTLIFDNGIDLRDFSAFELLRDSQGRQTLYDYYCTYAKIAKHFGTGLVLDSPTWRCNSDWVTKLDYGLDRLATFNREAIALVKDVQRDYQTDWTPIVISGCVGPRGDGYVVEAQMSPSEAQAYHHSQIEAFSLSGVDMVCAITMTYVDEAIGVANAARHFGMPVAISFTVETDGNLPTGQPLDTAIEQVDAATDGYASYYMINCAHPIHFRSLFDTPAAWHARVKGIRANASRMSHAELDAAADLDRGDVEELGKLYAWLKTKVPQLTVMGGCCGTGPQHIESIATHCLPLFQ